MRINHILEGKLWKGYSFRQKNFLGGAKKLHCVMKALEICNNIGCHKLGSQRWQISQILLCNSSHNIYTPIYCCKTLCPKCYGLALVEGSSLCLQTYGLGSNDHGND